MEEVAQAHADIMAELVGLLPDGPRVDIILQHFNGLAVDGAAAAQRVAELEELLEARSFWKLAAAVSKWCSRLLSGLLSIVKAAVDAVGSQGESLRLLQPLGPACCLH